MPIPEFTLRDFNKIATGDYNAGLDDEMKAMPARVAGLQIPPREIGEDGKPVEKLIVGDLAQIAQAAAPQGQPVPLGDIQTTAESVKDFIADLVFSDDTMVADVVVNRPGEKMRAFPGETLADAVAKPDFAARFAAFLRDPEKLKGGDLAKFESAVQTMANNGCNAIQVFINDVFKINTNAVRNAQGGFTTEPYKDKTRSRSRRSSTRRTSTGFSTTRRPTIPRRARWPSSSRS